MRYNNQCHTCNAAVRALKVGHIVILTSTLLSTAIGLESTASRPICEVNRSAAQLVPRWGTTRESWVLWFLFLLTHYLLTSYSL